MMNWYLALYMAIIFVLSINNKVTAIYLSKIFILCYKIRICCKNLKYLSIKTINFYQPIYNQLHCNFTIKCKYLHVLYKITKQATFFAIKISLRMFVYFAFCTFGAKNNNYKWKIFFVNCSIQNQTIKGNLYRKYTLTNKKKLKMQYTKTQSKQTIVWLVFTIWTVCKLIRKLNLLLQLRFYGTGAFYKAYQMVYGKGKWKIQDMINHFETSHRLSKPMVNHDLKKMYCAMSMHIQIRIGQVIKSIKHRLPIFEFVTFTVFETNM